MCLTNPTDQKKLSLSLSLWGSNEPLDSCIERVIVAPRSRIWDRLATFWDTPLKLGKFIWFAVDSDIIRGGILQEMKNKRGLWELHRPFSQSACCQNCLFQSAAPSIHWSFDASMRSKEPLPSQDWWVGWLAFLKVSAGACTFQTGSQMGFQAKRGRSQSLKAMKSSQCEQYN